MSKQYINSALRLLFMDYFKFSYYKSGEFGIFLYIMLPLAKPALGALAIFSFMGNWNSFLFPYIVLTNDAKRPLQVGLLNFQQRYYTDYRLLFAAIVLSIIPVTILYILFHRQFIQGIASGALKE